MEVKGKRCLITGATGFIGSHLAKTVYASGNEVIGLREPGQAGAGMAADLRDAATVARVVCDARPDLVFHLGAMTRITADNLLAAWEVNVAGTVHVLNALSALDAAIVFVSSAEVYGPRAVAPFSETTVPEPVSPYGIMKLAGENLIRLAAARQDVRAAIVRPGLVYGPGQTGMMIPDLLAAAVRDGRITTTQGEQTRDLLYIDDAARGIALAADAISHDTPVFNLGTGTSPSVKDVIEALIEGAGRDVLWDTTLPYRADEIMDYRLDVSRMEKVLDWTARVPWRDGLHATITAMCGRN